MKRGIWYLLPALLVIGMLLVPAGAVDSPDANDGMNEADFITATSNVVRQTSNLTIVETAEADGNFTTLVSALNVTLLDETLGEDGPFTVFAPTDEAFENLGQGYLDQLLENPADLTELLLYHVVDGNYSSEDLAELTELETLNGENVTITLIDEGILIDLSLIIGPDVDCSNGVIHVIDQVLIPPGFGPGPGPGLDANFTADVTTGEAPLTVLFNDTSTGENITAWAWDFGDGGTSTEQNPMYVYVSPGNYTVSLTVTDESTGNSDTEVKEDFITVGGAAPGLSIYETAAANGNFTILVTALDLTGLNTTLDEPGAYTVFAPTDEAFLNLPEGVLDALVNDTAALSEILLYHVADGEYLAGDLVLLDELETLNGENVTIMYDAANDTLMINDAMVIIADIGCTNGVIHVIDAVLIPPEDGEGVADFVADVTEGEPPLTVQFTDMSTVANITSWSWDFGAENATSTERDPAYTYETAGNYTVSLTVTDDQNMTYTEVKEDYINVTEAPVEPVADFVANVTEGEPPLAVQFTDMSTVANITSWSWDFGAENATSTEQDPVYIYDAAGNYTVSLTVTDDQNMTYTEVKEDYIIVSVPVTPDWQIDLFAGWNFISVPKRLDPAFNTAAIFSTVDTAGRSVFLYDPVDGWLAMTPEDEVNVLDGIWIYANTSVSVPLFFDDDPVQAPATKQLSGGWNAIGFSDTEAATARNTMTSVVDSWATIIGYDAEVQGYEVSIMNGGLDAFGDDRLMLPSKGYWTFMKEDGVLAAISA